MPSSTFNSETAPAAHGGSWGRTWLLALVFCVSLLACLEGYFRFAGHRPSVMDDKSLWAYWRQKASGIGTNAIVLLGNSRMQLGFSLDAWKQMFPDQTVLQLAVDGSNPAPVLQDLASDPAFHGIVICDIEAWTILGKDWMGPETEYLSYFHKQWGPAKETECVLRTILQRHIVLLNPGLSPGESIGLIVRGRFPGPQYLRMRPDRSVQADYKLADVEMQKHRWRRLNRGMMVALKGASRQQWHEDIKDFSRWVQRIRARGGNVIFVRFPSSGEVREIEEQYFPKTAFWDDFAELVGAECIHYEEVPSLRGFRCPEDSHLDERDAPRFTQSLAEELVRRGLLGRQWRPKSYATGRPSVVPNPQKAGF